MLAPVTNAPRDYAWGSTTLIAELEGRAASGRPEAEVWFGDHPGCPSRVADGTGRTLDAWLADRGAAPLPYLLKLLAAASPLSIQVHPSRSQAQDGFAREEAAGIPRDAAVRTYRDANHKPELIVAVSERFRALAGLRPLDATRRLVASLGDDTGVRELARRLEGEDAAVALRGVLAWLLSGEAAETVADVAAAVTTRDVPGFEAEITAIAGIAAAYPGDPGIVVALLMNLVELARGEAVFVDAGVLHAYLDGLGVEIMAASDNVLRGGLTPKHLDVDELLRIVDTTPADPPRLPAVDGEFAPGIPDFALTRVQVGEEGARIALRGPAIALATAGRVRVAGAGSGDAHELGPGAAVFAEGSEGSLVCTGEGELFVAQPGRG